MIVALLRMTEQLLVFPEDATEDRSGPYQNLAPPLLALPDGAVRWLAESPDGRLMVDVPGGFVAALIEGKAEEAARLLQKALDTLDDHCPDPAPHTEHEWYTDTTCIRRSCPGRRSN